jgi:hypothetical protein
MVQTYFKGCQQINQVNYECDDFYEGVGGGVIQRKINITNHITALSCSAIGQHILTCPIFVSAKQVSLKLTDYARTSSPKPK